MILKKKRKKEKQEMRPQSEFPERLYRCEQPLIRFMLPVLQANRQENLSVIWREGVGPRHSSNGLDQNVAT